MLGKQPQKHHRKLKSPAYKLLSINRIVLELEASSLESVMAGVFVPLGNDLDWKLWGRKQGTRGQAVESIMLGHSVQAHRHLSFSQPQPFPPCAYGVRPLGLPWSAHALSAKAIVQGSSNG